jgi:polyisoprenoid-binding protein YceI
MGSPMYGTFGKFEATLDFDTDNLANARTTLHIDLNSIDAGSEDANTELLKPAWFDTEKFPGRGVRIQAFYPRSKNQISLLDLRPAHPQRHHP